MMGYDSPGGEEVGVIPRLCEGLLSAVSVYVHIYSHVFVYIHIYMYIYVHLSIYLYTYKYIIYIR
jgi:hypothetical protein